MVTPTISPEGAGTATVTLKKYETGAFYYDLSATANPGYVFDHFESDLYWHVIYRTSLTPREEGPEIRHLVNTNNPIDIFEDDYDGPTLYTEIYYTKIVAVFRKEEPTTKFTVTTGMTPNAARGSTSGDGEYEDGTSCTVSCSAKCSLWIFDHWEFSTGETHNTQSVTFTVTADVTCTAVFRHENTGQLIYDADGSGSLICAADGNLLYDGDLVSP